MYKDLQSGAGYRFDRLQSGSEPISLKIFLVRLPSGSQNKIYEQKDHLYYFLCRGGVNPPNYKSRWGPSSVTNSNQRPLMSEAAKHCTSFGIRKTNFRRGPLMCPFPCLKGQNSGLGPFRRGLHPFRWFFGKTSWRFSRNFLREWDSYVHLVTMTNRQGATR